MYIMVDALCMLIYMHTVSLIIQGQKKQGVIAASAGNHALALALHGRQLDIPVVVMMPEVAPLMKVHVHVPVHAVGC